MSSTSERINVLYVDDDPNLTDLVADFLEREDDRFSVQTATSASAGLESLSDTDVDCIISDYDMPGQNGIEFLETVREDWPELPFVLYTGKGSEEVASGAISSGVTDYLQKESGTEQYAILANRVVNAVERYRANQHIERQNDLFRKAQDIAKVGAWEYDVETETVYNSEEVLKIHGLSPEENLSAEMSLEYYHPEDQPIIRSAFQKAIEEGKDYDVELRLVDEDGHIRWVRTRGEPQYVDGEIVRIRGTIQDITDRKQREKNLERFKKSAESAGHAIYFTDSDGTIEYVNSAFEEITGYSAEEATGKGPRILKSGEMSDDYYDRLWDCVMAGEIWEEEVVNRRKNGELYAAHQTIAPILDENDDIEAFVAIQTDITDRKEERERLSFLETLENELIELSIDFLRTKGRDIDTLIDDALKTLGELVDADRSYVFDIDHEAEKLSNTHEWCAEGVHSQINRLQDIPLDTFPWWMQQLEDFENVTIPAVAELPPEAEAEQEILQEQNIKSLIVTPMITQGELVGFIGFDWVEEQEAWSDDFIDILRMTSELVTSARRRDTRKRELERHEAYLEESQDSITVVDENGIVQFQSDSIEGTTGYRPSEIVGESVFDHVRPGDRQNVTELFTSLLETPGDAASADLRVETKDGSWRWVEARGVNKLDDPVINGIITSSRDITEEKERARELELFEQLIDQSNDEVYVTDAETGIFQRVNQTACDNLGYSEEELVGMTVPEISGGVEDVDEWVEIMEEVDKEGGAQNEGVHIRADGTTYPVEASVSYVELDEGAYEIAIVRDVTERKEQEAEIKSLKERLELAVEGANLGVWDWELTTDEVEFNEQWAQMIGYSLDEIEPHLDAWEKRVHPADIDKVKAALDAHVAGETDYYDTEHRIQTANGEWKWIRDVGRVVERDNEGDPIRAVGIHQDITDRKEREQQLREEKERLGEFTSVVSHDLRNPLNVAQGQIELAQEECDADHLDPAAEAIERSVGLIDDMLELARAGQDVGDTEPVEVSELVSHCWDTVETANASIEAEIGSNIWADRTRLRQLLENLFRNAIDHGGEDVSVRVGSLADGFYVEDTGPGIPETVREDVWETGYSSTGEGAGIGLSIVKQIVEAHGWKIRIVEGSEGGARFEITGVEIAAE